MVPPVRSVCCWSLGPIGPDGNAEPAGNPRAGGAVCLDIGANIGWKALQMAHHAHAGRVIAVEAGGPMFHVLSATLANLFQDGLVTDLVLTTRAGRLPD